MTKKTVVFGGLIGTLLLGGVALAGGPRGGDHMGRLLSQLELTEDQKALAFDARQEIREIRQETRQTRGELKSEAADMFATNAVDGDRLHALVDEGAALMADSMHQTLDVVLGVYTSLDADQRAELSELIAERRAEAEADEAFEGRRGRRGFDAGPGSF